ncbi:MAG: translational GTPase TypA [Candidatus Paceibacterota bacterium]|nr:MAG: translational GTPase TypA [Candidatus Paceibacterota bacterium]
MHLMQKIRNIAIIAHVDHGKTTLVDFLLKQSGTFHAKAEELSQDLIMDSNELERERGITILAKNTAVIYKDTKINIVDTPGHADFGGEVERTLNMADGAILLVDAQEGPMPQTKFVLKKALQLGLKVIVVVNKIDKPGGDIARTIDETTNLFLQLAHDESHLDFPIVYAIGREGKAWDHIPTPEERQAPGSLVPLFDAILAHVPAPHADASGTLQMLVAALDRDTYQGRYAIGRLARGTARPGQRVAIIDATGAQHVSTIEKVFVFQGLKRAEVAEAFAGDIIAVTGVPEAHISWTITDVSNPEPLPSIAIEEPTLRITLGPNTSPFMGQEGKFVTSRQIGERLERELETNVGMRLNPLGNGEYVLSGRGELHLSVFLETLRREGFEMQVSKPEVIFKEMDGVLKEPVEEVTVDVPEEYVGTITTEFGKRRAELTNIINHDNGYSRMVYLMPTRAFLGLRNILMTATKGTIVMNTMFAEYRPVGEALPRDRNGVLIASEAGQAVAFGLEVAQGRGSTFIGPGEKVYEGMIVGLNSRREDLEINVVKGKELTNMRSKSSDGVTILAPPVVMSLEQALDFIEDDELLELTPEHIRMRKRYLSRTERDKARRAQKDALA